MTEYAVYSAALVGGPPWGFRVASVDHSGSSYPVYVAQVIPQSRADNEGVKVGDVVLTVNGKDVAGLELHEVQRLLKRSTGIIRLTLRRTVAPQTGQRRRSQSVATPVIFSNDFAAPRYHRVRKRVSASGDIDFSYSSEIENTVPNYVYGRPEVRSAVPFASSDSTYGGTAASWNETVPAALTSKPYRTWTPVHFAPIIMSSAPVSPIPQSTVYSRRTVTTTRKTIDRELDKYLSPPQSGHAYQQSPTLTAEQGSAETIEEGSLTPKAAASSSTTPVIVDGQAMQESHSPFPASASDTVSDRHEDNQTRSPEKAVSAVDGGPKSDQSSAQYSADNELRRSENVSAEIESSTPQYLQDMAFYAETFSEHPSLGSSSLGIDFGGPGSRTGDAESVTSDGGESGISVKSSEQCPPSSVGSPSLQPTDNSENNIATDTGAEEPPLKDGQVDDDKANVISQLCSEENITDDTNTQTGTSFERLLASQPEPHYPHAFEQKNMIPVDLPTSMTATSFGTTTMSSGVTSYNAYEPYSSSLRGPNYKATQNPAIWSPRTTQVETNNIPTESRVYDVPIAQSQFSQNTQMPCYSPPYADSVIQSSDEQRTAPASMNTSGTVHTSVLPPPPPPPPPPPGGRYLASRKAVEEAETEAANDPNRSVVEYPEKQSVASLRTAIATKFNGTAPIKGSLPTYQPEGAPLKERDLNAENVNLPYQQSQQHFASSNIESSAPVQTYQGPPPPRPPQPYQAFTSNAMKSVENATSNLMSSVVGPPSVQQRREETGTYVNPLSVSTGMPGPGRWSGAPARPPLPPDMTSPTPPALPPAPVGFTMQPSPTMSSSSLASSGLRFGGRPDNFARPYERTSIRGTDTSSNLGEHYATPYRETTTVTRRRVTRHGDGNYKYEDVGPVDSSGTPLGLREMVPANDQHQWYKMMYKKMHQIDRKEDPSVLRYRLRDGVADRYFVERSPRRQLGSSAGSSPQRVGYKFAEFLADLPQDDERGGMDFDKSYTPKPFNIFETRGHVSRNPERDIYGPTNRSHSATRFDVLATPPPSSFPPHQPPPAPVEPVNAMPVGSYQYHAPRPVERNIAVRSVQESEEKRRVQLLSNRPQSAVAFGTRYDYEPRRGVQSYAAAGPKTYVQRRELSPMKREEARQWYQSVQSGGDAPFTGFRQPAPPGRDPLLRTAWHCVISRPRDRRKSEPSTRDICVQTTNGENCQTATSLSPGKQLALELSTWRQPSGSPKPVHRGRNTDFYGQPLTMQRRNSGATPEKVATFSSPVKTLDGSSKLYAVERAKTKDFHLPPFRLHPSPNKDQNLDVVLDLEGTVRNSQEHYPHNRRCNNDQEMTIQHRLWRCEYEQSVAEGRRREDEFRDACRHLQEAMKDIEHLISDKLSLRRFSGEDAAIKESHSQPYGMELAKRSRSTPAAIGYSNSATAFNSVAHPFRMTNIPISHEKRQMTCDREDVTGEESGILNGLKSTKRTLSLPDLCHSHRFVSSSTWHLKSTNSNGRSVLLDQFDTSRGDCVKPFPETTTKSRDIAKDQFPGNSCGHTSNLQTPCDASNIPIYASSGISSSHVRSNNDRLDFDIDEFSRLEKELTQEDERRKQQLKELEDQKAKWKNYSTPTPQFSPAVQQPTGIELRAVAKALHNSVAQSNKELSFRKGDLIKIYRQVDDNWYEGEVHGKVGILPVNYVDLAATAQGEERTTLTEVNTKAEGLAQALFTFEGKNANELPLIKGEFIVLMQQIDGNWMEGKNSYGRRGLFPANYVKIIEQPSNKSTDYVTAYTGVGKPQTFVRGDEPSSKMLPNGPPQINRTMSTESPATGVGAGRNRATAPPQQISDTFNARNDDLILKARQLAQNTRKEFGSRSNRSDSGAEALDAALAAGPPDSFQALFPYRPQNPDELELKENDIVYVVEQCDDGWFIGTSLRTGRFGTFPGNYVKRL